MVSYLCRSFMNGIRACPLSNSNLISNKYPIASLNNYLIRNYSDKNDREKINKESEKETDNLITKQMEALFDQIEDNDSISKTETSLPKLNKFLIAKASKIQTLGWQPTAETHSSLDIEGVAFQKLHIVNIKATKSNTLLNLTDHIGLVLFSTSSGSNGFKNSKKGTAVAGQAAGITLSENLKRRGIKDVRVTVRGFGNGRLPSIKALQMNGINVVSITDRTPIPLEFAKTPRPPAKRRI